MKRKRSLSSNFFLILYILMTVLSNRPPWYCFLLYKKTINCHKICAKINIATVKLSIFKLIEIKLFAVSDLSETCVFGNSTVLFPWIMIGFCLSVEKCIKVNKGLFLYLFFFYVNTEQMLLSIYIFKGSVPCVAL